MSGATAAALLLLYSCALELVCPAELSRMVSLVLSSAHLFVHMCLHVESIGTCVHRHVLCIYVSHV